jgi:hypothetical protein
MLGRNAFAAGTYQTLVFVVVDDYKSEVVAFGKLDDGKRPTATRFMKSVR